MQSILTKDLSKEQLLELNKEFEKFIKEKIKRDALNLSGWIDEKICVGGEDLSLLEDPYEIQFVKWFTKEKLGATSLPKYIHKINFYKDADDPYEVSHIDYYLFSDEKMSLNVPAGNAIAIKIHNESKKYLLEEYREWC